MSYGPLTDVLRHIRRIAIAAEVADFDDDRLMARFIERGDEAAFEALLRRHGPMVLGVCRRLLRNPQDIEDAFQATFLVLLRRAHSLRRRDLVAHWLHGAAYRTALKARNKAVRCRVGALVDLPVEETQRDVERNDLRAVLDTEVQHLPAKYRMPVILCYLEGKTFEQAAKQLGWPLGTVAGRLARARQLLRTRLTRRGLGLTVGMLGIGLSQTASAVVPGELRTATVKAALILIGRHADAAWVIPSSVIALMEGVLNAMFITKLKVASIVLLALAVASGGAGMVTYQRLVAQPPSQKEASAQKIIAPAEQTDEAIHKEAQRLQDLATAAATPEDKLKASLDKAKVGEKMKSLLWARFDAANTEVKIRWREFCEYGREQSGRRRGGPAYLIIPSHLQPIYGSSRRLLEAELDLINNGADKVVAWESHLKRMQQAYVIFFEWSRLNEIFRVNHGGTNSKDPITDLKQAEYYRLEAEIGLERAKAELIDRR